MSDAQVRTGAAATDADVLRTTEDCRYCWMCRHVCPVGHVTHRETFTPHAWALTIASVARGALQWNAETADVLYSCADCGLCRAHCVTDRPLPDAIALARAQVVSAGQAPHIVRELDEKLRTWGNPYGDRAALQVGDVGGIDVGGSSDGSDTTGARGEIALFVGDAAPFLAPGTLAAARALLAAAGVNAVPIGVGRSTGLLADTLGLADTARTLARDLLDELRHRGCRQLIVFSAADRYAFERVYTERLRLDWPADVTLVELTTVLADAWRAGRITFPPPPASADTPLANGTHAPTFAYHDASHGPRLGHDAASAHALLAAVLGDDAARHPFWRANRAHPTGATGGLAFTQPAIASALNDARIADAARAGARWLITDEPADLHQLRAHATGVEVVCLYELLNERLVR